ncbi:metallopeptidase family protein [candidate division KSB1 bacterium]|nr:metallopeptidase family protein [candidate division KSB1 bacterium]NIV70236.1 hypothetical protein [Phycisphaerae bacterium]NIR71124.1 metallopeptidase family protein [candidate division KSB1 bacterium]NIS26140.1 metallopeptidase family protein [candidate division KSB1 bacterium]NIT74286.1 metallopeptidase family protein [candidate division KSB1 bacterium]
MKQAEFEKIVDEEIARLPRRFRKAIRNMSIVVEDEPDAELLADFGHDTETNLLGLYVGVPLPERAFGEEPYLPDQIFLFRRPLQRLSRTTAELRKQIRTTLIHELAHYFGFDDDYLTEIGLD